jgi:hypothetical protein
MTSEVGTVLTVEEMLARSKAAAEAKSSAKGGSKIQQMIAEMEKNVDQDSVDLSPVARLLKSQQQDKTKTETPYTEQDWYIRAKVAQLKSQIEIYSNLPGLDPSGGVMDALTKEVNELVGKQQAKLKKSQDEAAAKQAELDKLNAEKANAPLSVDDMLKRAKLRSEGKDIPVETSDAVKKLLENSKGKVVDQTA